MQRPLSIADLVKPKDAPEDAILRVLRVPAEYAGMRVDQFVKLQLKRTSRTRAQLIVRNSAFSHDGRRLAPGDRVHAEDLIALWRSPLEEDLGHVDLPILYEDEHLLAINKPAGIAVHPTARYYNHTVVRKLAEARPGEMFHLIHRLDRETSGVLLLAKTAIADRAFKRALEERSVSPQNASTSASMQKVYLAIVRGKPADGLVDLRMELDPHSRLRVKMRIAAAEAGMLAKTQVQVLDSRGDYSLVECQLHTGRQHQIRVHMAALGCPVVGDKLYGPDEELLARAADGKLSSEDHDLLVLPRQALHAHRYSLKHAISGEMLEIVAPLASDLAQFWELQRG